MTMVTSASNDVTDTGRRRPVVTIAGQTALIVAGFFAYLGVRSLANGSEATAFANARKLLDVERVMGLDIEQSAQRAALELPGFVEVFNFVYAWTYWPYIIGAFVITWFWRRDLFLIYRNAMVFPGAIGLAFFALTPVAPPRFLDGFVDTVDAAQRGNFIAHPAGMINEFAALPSFHVGWVAMASVVMAMGVDRRWLQWSMRIVPTSIMSIAVVVTANHYILDIVAGIGLAMVGVVVAKRLAMRSARMEPRQLSDLGHIGQSVRTRHTPDVASNLASAPVAHRPHHGDPA